ncbi:MAG: hypothetical protein K2N87_14535 [Eubacterium sp.]|nr:hypothetical protein [Eubacterium sp.]
MTAAGLKRALRYFARQAEVYVLCIIGGSFAMAVYMRIINSNTGGISQVLGLVPGISIWISGVVLFTIGISSYQYCYSIPVSFGCTRRHAFLGTLVMDFLVIAQGMLFYFLSSAWFGIGTKTFSSKRIEALLIFCLFLLLESVANVIGITVMRWGKAAYVLMGILLIIGTVSFGVIVGLSSMSGMTTLAAELLGGHAAQSWQWMLLAAAAIVSAAINAASWRILKSFEVKA